MMRQYKVKQRYLNRLLESFQDTTVSPEALRQQEEEVRAALEAAVPPVSPDPHTMPLSRSSSFYSLPEYVIDDEGILRPSPIIGRHTSNSARKGTENRNSPGVSGWSANDISESQPISGENHLVEMEPRGLDGERRTTQSKPTATGSTQENEKKVTMSQPLENKKSGPESKPPDKENKSNEAGTDSKPPDKEKKSDDPGKSGIQ
ncbi:hypothetical protein COOONC_18820 [Cooperia oncophora]